MRRTTWMKEDKPEPKVGCTTPEKPIKTSSISAVANCIYFYSDIDADTIKELSEKLREMSQDIEVERLKKGFTGGKIELHINSMGGEVFSALAAYDIISRCSIPVTCIVEGAAASAATFLLLGGKERLMYPNSMILIHQLSSIVWDRYDHIKDEVGNLDRHMDTIKKIYLKHTNIPKKKLSEILTHDIWFTAKESLEYGLVHKIIE